MLTCCNHRRQAATAGDPAAKLLQTNKGQSRDQPFKSPDGISHRLLVFNGHLIVVGIEQLQAASTPVFPSSFFLMPAPVEASIIAILMM
ncbi:hypothetical protein ASC96_12565 [Rhizobium sp. Root1204]|nr:hypothetical protein ASC96_12565 [Rhizobium sp. Root1204]